MEGTSSTTDRPLRIPRIAWIVGAGMLVAFVAITVFNVPLNTVVYYGFIFLMIAGHFFMHGSHGGHGSHGEHTNSATNTGDDAEATQSADKRTRHSGGCH